MSQRIDKNAEQIPESANKLIEENKVLVRQAIEFREKWYPPKTKIIDANTYNSFMQEAMHIKKGFSELQSNGLKKAFIRKIVL